MALTEMGTNHPASQTGQILRVWRKIRFGAGIGLFIGLVLASPWCLVLVEMMQELQPTFEYIHGLHVVGFSGWLTFNGNGPGQFGYNAALVVATPIFLYGALVPPALGCLIRSLSRRPAEAPLVSEEKRFLTHGYR